MIPTKCPNCRLSLPQNWSGASDPNAKCPYCGKPIAGSPSAPTGAAPAQPASPPAPKAAAKTILWGVGAPIPGSLANKPGPAAPVPQPSPQPVPPSSPQPARVSTRDALGQSETVPRNAISEPASAQRSRPIAPVAPVPDPAEIEVDVSEAPVPEPANVAQPMVKPSHPAATVMFEPGPKVDTSLSNLDGLSSSYGGPVRTEAPQEPEPPAEPSPRPVPTKAKGKGKPLPRKVYKPNSSLANKRGDDIDDLDTPPRSSSKAGIIVFLVLLAAAAAVIVFVVLRGRGSESAGQDNRAAASKSKPIIEPAALAPKPAPFEPPAPAEEPAPAAPPARPAKAEKPTRAEKPARAEKAEPASAASEPKVTAGKPSEDDYRRANEAYQRGNAKLFQGNEAEAIAEFKLAVKLNPKDPANHRGLGLAYEKAGKVAEAIKQLKMYIKAAPKANDRAIIERRINELRGR